MGAQFDGPFPIVERTSQSCIKIKVGSFANGLPRIEMHHWANCKPVPSVEAEKEAVKVNKGRKQLNPQAKAFTPTQPPPFKTGAVKPPHPFRAPMQHQDHSAPIDIEQARTQITRMT